MKVIYIVNIAERRSQTSVDLKQPESNEVHTENVTSVSEYEKEKTLKKSLPYIIAALVLVVGCGWWYFSSSGQRTFTKEISPISTEFDAGELADLIEIVDEPCQLCYTEETEVTRPYMKLTVKLKLKKGSPELKKVNARDILLDGPSIDLLDETKSQNNLSLRLFIKTDELKLKKFLQGEKGDVETFVFETEDNRVPTWFEIAVAFVPYYASPYLSVSKDASSDEESENDSSLPSAYELFPLFDDPEININMTVIIA